jgi:hypothetical protein
MECGALGFQFLEIRGALRMKTTVAPSTRRYATISNHGSDGTTSPTTVSRDSVAGDAAVANTSTVTPLSATYSQIEKAMRTATTIAASSTEAGASSPDGMVHESALTIDASTSSESKQRALLIAQLEQTNLSMFLEAKKASEGKQRGLLVAQLEQNRRLKEKLDKDSQSIPSFQHAKEGDHVTMLGSQPIETPIDLGPESRLTDRQDVISLARQQPKSREEDLKFQERYDGMSLEDRAFTLLYDLGMVEKNVGPNDPNYELMLQERYGAMSLQDRAFAILYDLGMVEKN